MRIITAIAVATMFGSPSVADVKVAFFEGAPKDRFVLTNSGIFELTGVEVTVNLAGSDSGLIFDITEGGSGVEVFQPFQIASGRDLLSETPKVRDGDKSVTLRLDKFGQGQLVVFTIDVDDTGGNRETTVSNGEIRGATATVATSTATFSRSFEGLSQTSTSIPGCAV